MRPFKLIIDAQSGGDTFGAGAEPRRTLATFGSAERANERLAWLSKCRPDLRSRLRVIGPRAPRQRSVNDPPTCHH